MLISTIYNFAKDNFVVRFVKIGVGLEFMEFESHFVVINLFFEHFYMPHPKVSNLVQ